MSDIDKQMMVPVYAPTGRLIQPGKFGMTILYERPPVWENILNLFKINTDTTIFTYGDIIYNPAGFHIDDEYIFHESIHAEQQGHTAEDAAAWWARYFQDQYFRIQQEAEAYGAQYEFWCRTNKDRNMRDKKLRQLAATLASPMYGSVVGVTSAMGLIREQAKV